MRLAAVPGRYRYILHQKETISVLGEIDKSMNRFSDLRIDTLVESPAKIAWVTNHSREASRLGLLRKTGKDQRNWRGKDWNGSRIKA
jgi:hypothetical protein